jgi:hypothetical protein
LLFFELLNEVHRKISIGGAPSLSGAAARTSIYPVCGFGAPIRQRQSVVTRPSCFSDVFG